MRVVRKRLMIDNFPSLIRALSERGISRSGKDGDGEREELGEGMGDNERDMDSTEGPRRSENKDSGGAGSIGDHGVDNSMKNPALASIQSSNSSESSRTGSPEAWGRQESPSAPVCLSAGMWTSSKSKRRMAEIHRFIASLGWRVGLLIMPLMNLASISTISFLTPMVKS